MPCGGSTSTCFDGALGDRGREVKNVGDGLMVVFPSASVAADGCARGRATGRRPHHDADR